MCLASNCHLHLFLVAMTTKYRTKLAKYWQKIETETDTSLESISANDLLDEGFKDDFLDETITR